MSESETTSNIPCFVIYCDESCHELTPQHKFMSIGGLKVPRTEKTNLSRKLRQLMRSMNLNSELKWSKVSDKRLKHYQKIIDFFFEHAELCFRAIIVEQAKVRFDQYHNKDRELAFYKFYYEMLEKWMEAGNEYLILLDYKSNSGAERYTKLKTCLEQYWQQRARIRDLTIIDSKQTPLAQLCDVLTGSIAAACNVTRSKSPKENLVKYITERSGLQTLCTSTPLSEEKFNIFKMNLR